MNSMSRSTLTRRLKAGTNLLELLTATVIVMILTMICYPSYKEYVDKARISEATVTLAVMEENLRTYFLHYGTFMSAAPNPSVVPGINSAGTQGSFGTSTQWTRLGEPITPGSNVTFSYQAFAGQTIPGSTQPVVNANFFSPHANMDLERRGLYVKVTEPAIRNYALHSRDFHFDFGNLNFNACADEMNRGFSDNASKGVSGNVNSGISGNANTGSSGDAGGDDYSVCVAECRGDPRCVDDCSPTGGSKGQQCIDSCVSRGGRPDQCAQSCNQTTDGICDRSVKDDPDCVSDGGGKGGDGSCELGCKGDGNCISHCSCSTKDDCEQRCRGDASCISACGVNHCTSYCNGDPRCIEACSPAQTCEERCNRDERCIEACSGTTGSGTGSTSKGETTSGGSSGGTTSGETTKGTTTGGSGSTTGESSGGSTGGHTTGGSTGTTTGGSMGSTGGTTMGETTTGGGQGAGNNPPCEPFTVATPADFGIRDDVSDYHWVIVDAVANLSDGSKCTLVAKVIQTFVGEPTSTGFILFNAGD
jgi:type II secretory pathway pseudopilin PulG